MAMVRERMEQTFVDQNLGRKIPAKRCWGFIGTLCMVLHEAGFGGLFPDIFKGGDSV